MLNRLLQWLMPNREPRTPEEALARVQKVRALLKEADSSYKTGQVRRSMTLYQKVIRLDPKNVPAYVNLGAIYSQQPGMTSDAIVVMEAARTLDPRNTTIHLNLATLYTQQGKFDLAMGILDDLKLRDSAAPGLHYARACVYFYRGDPPLSIPELKEELRINPQHIHAANLLKQLEEVKK